ncbi:MAG: GC-type dockerin domain-anchored protein [Planctomycetota bacterium]
MKFRSSARSTQIRAFVAIAPLFLAGIARVASAQEIPLTPRIAELLRQWEVLADGSAEPTADQIETQKLGEIFSEIAIDSVETTTETPYNVRVPIELRFANPAAMIEEIQGNTLGGDPADWVEFRRSLLLEDGRQALIDSLDALLETLEAEFEQQQIAEAETIADRSFRIGETADGKLTLQYRYGAGTVVPRLCDIDQSTSYSFQFEARFPAQMALDPPEEVQLICNYHADFTGTIGPDVSVSQFCSLAVFPPDDDTFLEGYNGFRLDNFSPFGASFVNFGIGDMTAPFIEQPEPGRYNYNATASIPVTIPLHPDGVGGMSRVIDLVFFQSLGADNLPDGLTMDDGAGPVVVDGSQTFVLEMIIETPGIEVAAIAPPAPCPADLTTTGATLPGSFGYGVPDGEVDLDDLGYMIFVWLNNEPAADLTTTGATLPGATGFGTPDGIIDLDDLGYFIGVWLAGCP